MSQSSQKGFQMVDPDWFYNNNYSTEASLLQEDNSLQPSQLLCGNIGDINAGFQKQEINQANKESIEIVLSNDNQFPIIQKGNNISITQLNELNRKMGQKQTDLTFFWNLWNRQDLKSVIQSFQFIVKPQNWHLNRYQYQKQLQKFLYLFSSLVQQQPYINQIYPGLKTLLRKIQNLTEIRTSKNTKNQQKYTNKLYRHYLDQIKSRIKRQGAYYIKDEAKNEKIPLSDFIANQANISASHAWKDIYFKATVYKKNQQQKLEEDPQIKRQNRKRQQIRDQILINGNIIYAADNHLCCAQYFYFNQKIFDEVVTQCPLLIAAKGVKALTDVNSNLLEETALDICALLNSGGGIILFDVNRTYFQIWPKGETILQREFSQFKSKIQSVINFISPRITMQKEVIVNYVPVCRNPITNSTSDRVTQKQYIQGLYVMRIIIKPSQDTSEYIYYYSKEEHEFKTAIVENNKRKNLSRRQIIRFMKKKFNNYYISQNDYQDQQEKHMIKRAYSWFGNHQVCLQPQKGLILVNRIRNEEQFNDKQLQKRFKYITLIVTNRSNLATVKERLVSKGIQCEIVVKYSQYRFKTANNSAALYHNLRFDHLLSQVAYKKQFQFNGRFILTILVTKLIKLQNRNKGNIVAESDFQTLQKWLQTEHPNQKLIMWKYEQSRDNYEFYIETGSKISTLFMYYVMNHYNQKCMFKNPREYERLTEKQKKERFTVFYPRETRRLANLGPQSV